MKTQKITLFKDEQYQIQVKADMERARSVIQQTLDEWNFLNIGDITDLNELLTSPETCYNRAIDEKVTVPKTDSQFQVKKSAHLATLDLPSPQRVYETAKKALKMSYAIVPGLFVTDGKIVSIDPEISEFYITMSDVVIGNTQPDKVALAADLKTFVELFNSLNTRLNGELFDSSSPVSNRFIQGNFTFENTDQRGCNGKIAFNIDALRRWFNNAV